MKAIELCVARFDDETKTAFLDLYTKLDSKADDLPAGVTLKIDEVPF
jgi:hypothetical protein